MGLQDARRPRVVLTIRADYAGTARNPSDFWYVVFYLVTRRRSIGPYLIEGLEETITFVGDPEG